MPWDASSAHRFTHKAKTRTQRKMWAEVANDVLRRTGDEARAVRSANAVIRAARRAKRKAK
jgi:hypothetical protein